jgi:hypothetical protein
MQGMTMKRVPVKNIILFFVGLLCFAATVLADGLPGEYVIDQQWRDLNSRYSPLTNAAFLTETNYITPRFAYATMLQNYFQLWELGVTVPVNLYQSIGLSWIGEGSGKFAEIDPLRGSIDLGQVRYQNDFLAGSYAINPWNGLSAGANLNVVHQNAFGSNRFGWGLDLGVSYRLLKSALLGNHLIGIFGQNLIAPTLNALSGTETYSRNLRFSWYSNYWEKQIEVDADFCLKDLLASASEFQQWDPLTSSFKSVSQKLEWEFDAKAAYTFLQTLRISALIGINQHGFNRWAAGLGADVPSVNQGRDLAAQYQYTSPPKGEQFFSNTFYLLGEFGLHREELYAKKMSATADVAPNQIYLKALALYGEGKFWDAYFLFSQIQNDYPDFFKADWVIYYAGSCQEGMDMRDAAVLSYQTVKLEFPLSNAVPPSELGVMRINYRNEDYASVARQFEILTGVSIPDSIKYCATYVMGETFMQQKEYERAINLFKAIPSDHPDYIFAEHSAAVALLNKDKIQEAAVCLQNCLTAVPQTEAQKEMVNRANLFLGYMLYEGMIEEPQPLSKVVTLLRKIPSKSMYYEDALLLLGWTAIKARQTTDAIAAGTSLQNSKIPELYFEGCLITVYGYVMQNKFNEAKALIVPAVAKIASLAPPSEDSLTAQKQQYISTRTAYNFLAQKVTECAEKQQAGGALTENSALHEQQRTIKSNIDASLALFDSFKKDVFLTRNLAELKQDFNYMLAYTTQKAVGTDLQKDRNKTIEKQKKADEKIELLKKKLEEIEKKGK